MKSILVCTNQRDNPHQPSCGARGAQALKQRLTEEVNKAGMPLGIKEIQCLGACEEGPNVKLIPSGPMFQHVNVNDLTSLLKAAQAFAKS
ncbi:MAG TPA: (2Fe-2S) ferredoxin domain-containing protein [Methylophilus sp.]